MRWTIISGPRLIYYSYVMHVNFGIMLVMMNSAVCPPRLSLVLEEIYFIMRLTSRSSMLEVTKIVACPTFMGLLPDESLSNSCHPRDCHMRSDLSNFKYEAVLLGL